MAIDIVIFVAGLVLAAMTLRDVFETVVVPGGSKASFRVTKRLLWMLLPLWKAARGKRRGLSGSHMIRRSGEMPFRAGESRQRGFTSFAL